MDNAILLLILGIAFGGLIGWLIAKLIFANQFLSKSEVNLHYAPRELIESLERQLTEATNHLSYKEQEILSLSGEKRALEEQVSHLKAQNDQQKWEAAEWHRKSLAEFEVLANKILSEKSQSFSQQNFTQINHILQPLQEKINHFEAHINQRLLEETRDRISLKKEIEQLANLNQQLSEDANSLADALKGNSKVQGDWGEMQLEMLLKKSGLEKDIHFRTQAHFKDVEGKAKRPDFIIQLPGDKHLIIDSKVSLRDFEKYHNAKEASEKTLFLKRHIQALRQHVKSLSSKNYQHLYQINSPDYVLLFIPLDQAFLVAQETDQNLFLEALENHIVIVTNATLLATLRTVAFIWKQEKQKNNVLEIARQSGLLYDKLCGFVEDLKDTGYKLDQAKKSYIKAMKKLSESDRSGHTLIDRAEKIRTLGAKTSKELPKDLLEP